MSTTPLPIINQDRNTGDSATVTVGGELVSAQRLRRVGGVIAGSLAPWYEDASSGGGSVVVSGAAAVVHSGAAVAGRGLLRSAHICRAIAPQQSHATIVASMSDVLTPGGRYRFGAFHDTDGYFFEIVTGASPSARVVSRKAGVDTPVTSPFSGPQPLVVDTSRHAYTIRYLVTLAHFLQDGVLRHSMRSTSVGPLLQDADVPVRVEAENVAGAGTDFIITASNAHISRIGPEALGSTRVIGPARIATSTASVNLAVENPMRRRLIIVNESTHTLYLKYGVTASLTDYVLTVSRGGTVTIPAYEWSGRVDGILDAGTGFAQVTATEEG